MVALAGMLRFVFFSSRTRSKICRLRIEFTEKDEARLCKYLAIRIPDKDAGGRKGRVVYMDMEGMVSESIS